MNLKILSAKWQPCCAEGDELNYVDTVQKVTGWVTGQNVDKPKRRQPKRRQTKTSINLNVDRPKRRQTKTSTSQNVDKPKRRQTEMSTNQNVDRPKRRQTKTSTGQNVNTPKRRQTLNVDTPFYYVGCYGVVAYFFSYFVECTACISVHRYYWLVVLYMYLYTYINIYTIHPIYIRTSVSTK